jgi:hypothetical protein
MMRAAGRPAAAAATPLPALLLLPQISLPRRTVAVATALDAPSKRRQGIETFEPRIFEGVQSLRSPAGVHAPQRRKTAFT